MGMPKYVPVVSNPGCEEGSEEVFLERKVEAYFLLWRCRMMKQIIKMVMPPALIPVVGKKTIVKLNANYVNAKRVFYQGHVLKHIHRRI